MRMLEKLRSHRGESITETLCAVLVAGLAVALLAGMVGAATRLADKANKTSENLYSAVAAAETQKEANETAGTVTITVTITVTGETESKPLTVNLYGNVDEVLSYAYAEETGGGS